MQLCTNLGADYLRDLHLGGNAHYTSEQMIAEFLHCLSTVIEEDMLTLLKQSSFYALMIDERTDVSVLKQLVLVARYVTDTEGVKTSFFNVADIFDGTAETIEAAILKYLDNKSLEVSKLCGFGNDGAAVMTGRHTGVATRLKAHTQMISIHCVNHRLALAAADAADNIPYLQRFKTNLRGLFTFYQNSPVCLAGLHAIQEVLNDPIIKCREAKDVRWLSH